MVTLSRLTLASGLLGPLIDAAQGREASKNTRARQNCSNGRVRTAFTRPPLAD
jgi:hypothetical protein